MPTAVSSAERSRRVRRKHYLGAGRRCRSILHSQWRPNLESITLPGVSSWSNFDWAYYLDARTVTADRVLANTFYLYYAGEGVFETTNGGVSWTQVYSGQIAPIPITMQQLNLFRAKPAICSLPADGKVMTQQNESFIDRPMAARRGPPFPMLLKSIASVLAHQRRARAIQRSTSSDMSTTSMASGNRSITLNHGPRSALIRTTVLTQSRPFRAIRIFTVKSMSAFSGSGYAYLPADPLVTAVRPRHQPALKSPATHHV